MLFSSLNFFSVTCIFWICLEVQDSEVEALASVTWTFFWWGSTEVASHPKDSKWEENATRWICGMHDLNSSFMMYKKVCFHLFVSCQAEIYLISIYYLRFLEILLVTLRYRGVNTLKSRGFLTLSSTAWTRNGWEEWSRQKPILVENYLFWKIVFRLKKSSFPCEPAKSKTKKVKLLNWDASPRLLCPSFLVGLWNAYSNRLIYQETAMTGKGGPWWSWNWSTKFFMVGVH